MSRLFEAAGLFPVPPSTLRDWSIAGRITSIRTLGGHRRYRESEARSLVADRVRLARAAA